MLFFLSSSSFPLIQRERKKDKEKFEQRKEQDLPNALNGGGAEEPARKRSKLVLPAPQISQEDLENMVKLGQAGQAARSQAQESGLEGSATQALLEEDYSGIGSATAATPMPARTPGGATEALLREAANVAALQNVETPLKGGLNTPLHEANGESKN